MIKRVIFVCHGNICRSVMAEYIFKYYSKVENLGVECVSRATSYEEIGNDIYCLAKETLDKNNIPYQKHQATRIIKSEYDSADLVIVMDKNNYYNLERIVGECDKIHYLKEYAKGPLEIEDPWYTRRFQYVFEEIKSGVLGLIKSIKNNM